MHTVVYLNQPKSSKNSYITNIDSNNNNNSNTGMLSYSSNNTHSSNSIVGNSLYSREHSSSIVDRSSNIVKSYTHNVNYVSVATRNYVASLL